MSRRGASGARSACLATALALAMELGAGAVNASPSGGPTAATEAFASSPARATASSARLLSGGTTADGRYLAGVEIDLDPGTITYWRSPGEAGAPPGFDFSGSINVAAVDVVYPAPKRIDEQGVVVAGYDTRVIFPLKVAPRDPTEPVTLSLSLHYSACGKICLPARAKLSLVLPRSGETSQAAEFAAAIADAESHAPRRLDPSEAQQALSIEKSAANSWRLTWRGQGKAGAVFAEVSEPLFLESVPHDGVFDLKLYPVDAIPSPLTAKLTVVTDAGAYEAPVTLR